MSGERERLNVDDWEHMCRVVKPDDTKVGTIGVGGGEGKRQTMNVSYWEQLMTSCWERRVVLAGERMLRLNVDDWEQLCGAVELMTDRRERSLLLRMVAGPGEGRQVGTCSAGLRAGSWHRRGTRGSTLIHQHLLRALP